MSLVVKPKLLLPKDQNFEKFAVIACDQFSGQPEYWKELEDFIDGAPSALDFILPEAFFEERLATAPAVLNENMSKFLKSGMTREIDGYVLLERIQADGRVRVGLMAAIDLDAYEYTEKNKAKIKATEKTDVDRLPPRVAIREKATLEMPHIMILLDDPKKAVIEELYAKRDGFEKLYDFKLNMGGGHLRGWLVPEDVTEQLLVLEKDGVLFVIGDGNHSLAAAKQCWQKSGKNRYALVELFNIHSEALDFEPIHRIIFGAGLPLIEHMQKSLKGNAELKMYFGGKYYAACVSTQPADAIADIQNLLDEYFLQNPELKIEYVHGDGHLITVADRDSALAIFMPTIGKDGLFDYASRRGVLPRKAFSMGHAEDKRYYLEMGVLEQ